MAKIHSSQLQNGDIICSTDNRKWTVDLVIRERGPDKKDRYIIHAHNSLKKKRWKTLGHKDEFVIRV